MTKTIIKPIKTDIATSRILAFIAENPDTTARQIAVSLELPAGTVAPTIRSLKEQGRIKDSGTLRQLCPETGDFLRGRPAIALRTTSKGRKAAQRIIAKIEKLTTNDNAQGAIA